MISTGGIFLEKALAIKGWMSPLELKTLAGIAQKSKFILEVGSLRGRSTRALCDNTDGIVVAVDPWNGPYVKDNGQILFDCAASFDDFVRNMEGTNVIVMRMKYRRFIEEYRDTAGPPERFDFIFLDGDHRYDEVRHDIEESIPLLKVGGVLAGHDYTHPDWPGVKKAVDEIFPDKEIIDSLWITQKY